MKMEAYIRILGSEEQIRALQNHANLPDATVKETKGRLWNYETQRVPINSEDLDDGLKALLRRYRPFFSAIRAHCNSDADVYLEVITKYEPNEEPRGLFLSVETISLLSELGAAVDNDVYR